MYMIPVLISYSFLNSHDITKSLLFFSNGFASIYIEYK